MVQTNDRNNRPLGTPNVAKIHQNAVGIVDYNNEIFDLIMEVREVMKLIESLVSESRLEKS